MNQNSSPFRPAEQVAPRIKAFIFGDSGAGKTYLSLTSPGKIAAIDTEGGMAFYARRAGKNGLSQFEILQTKTYRDVQAAVQYLAAHPGEFSTLVIDPITTIYETLQDAAQIKRAGKRHDDDADLEMLDWQRIKRSYKALMTELVNLPLHVVVIAREKDDTERKGNDTIKVGVKPDAEKGTSYFFDVVVRLVKITDAKGNVTGRKGVILKDRTGTHPLGTEILDPTFATLFGAAIKAGRRATGEREVPDDLAAAERDAVDTFGAPARQEPTQLFTADEVAGALEQETSAPASSPLDPRAFAERVNAEHLTGIVATARKRLFGESLIGDLTDEQRGELYQAIKRPA